MRDVLFRRKNWLGVERWNFECTFKTIVLKRGIWEGERALKIAYEGYLVHQQKIFENRTSEATKKGCNIFIFIWVSCYSTNTFVYQKALIQTFHTSFLTTQ